MPLEAYASLLIALLHFGQRAKFWSAACKYLKIMHAADAAFHMTPIFLTANSAGYVCATCPKSILKNHWNFCRHFAPLQSLN
jgi:hypothetical protein